MKKLLKLPLFLGVVGGICGGVLALTNAVTSEKIALGESIRANQAYLKHFEDMDTQNKKEASISESLEKAGVVEKLYIYNTSATYIGTVYTCSVVGFAGKATPIKFSVSFRDGNYNHYVTLSHGETSNGLAFMNWLSGDQSGERVSNLDQSGISTQVTCKVVKAAVGACYNDYTLDLNAGVK